MSLVMTFPASRSHLYSCNCTRCDTRSCKARENTAKIFELDLFCNVSLLTALTNSCCSTLLSLAPLVLHFLPLKPR